MPRSLATRESRWRYLNLHSSQKERGKSVCEEYARGIQTFKNLFAQYGQQELADSLHEIPQGSATGKTDEMNATAIGSSQPPPPEMRPPDRTETRIEDDHENLSTAIPPDESMTDDNFTLSGAATPAQDEPETGISQMEAADIESELNNFLTIDDPSLPWWGTLPQIHSQRLPRHPKICHRISQMNDSDYQTNSI